DLRVPRGQLRRRQLVPVPCRPPEPRVHFLQLRDPRTQPRHLIRRGRIGHKPHYTTAHRARQIGEHPTAPTRTLHAQQNGPPIELLRLNSYQRTGHHVYHTTGLDREEIIDLCIKINSEEREPGTPNWPKSLSLFNSVTVTLVYMRTNLTQAQIGEFYGVSQ